jgi:hypothetical protein
MTIVIVDVNILGLVTLVLVSSDVQSSCVICRLGLVTRNLLVHGLKTVES